jgi:fumarate hydratase class II
MEAVAALGVASNVFQFVQFAWSLFDTASSVYQSASGSAVEAETLEEIYGTLSQFNLDLKLNDSCRPIPSSNHEAELLKLAVSCEKKCQQLLGLVRKLKVAPGGKRKAWESFRVALRTVCHDAEFRTLEKEIGGYQKSMALLLCAIIRYVSAYLNSSCDI